MSYSVEKLDLAHLSVALKREYRLLLPTRFRFCLDGKDPDGIEGTKILAFSAMVNEMPAGIAVAGLYEEVGLVELYAVKIKEIFSNVELGKILLKTLEEEVFRTGALIINYLFSLSDPDTPILLNILKERDWVEPKLFMTRFFFEAYTFHPPWFENPPQLSEYYEEFPWKKLTEEERQILVKENKQGHYPVTISPFHEEDTIEPFTSLGLRYKKQVIGWVINHRIAPDTLRYSAFYVKPDFKHKGVSMRLLVDSMKLQQKSPMKWSIFEISHQDYDKSWNKIVLKRLAPYAIQVDKIYQTWKAYSAEVFKIQHKSK